MCDMTCSHVWHDSFTCVTLLIHTCDMTHSHVWHDSQVDQVINKVIVEVTGAEHEQRLKKALEVCVMSHMWIILVTRVNQSCCAYVWVVSHVNESCRTYEISTINSWKGHSRYESCHTCETVSSHVWISHVAHMYGVATVSRIDKIIGLFCKRAL